MKEKQFGRLVVFAKNKQHAIEFSQRMMSAGAIVATYPNLATSYYGHLVSAYFEPDHPFVGTLPGCALADLSSITDKHKQMLEDLLQEVNT